MVFRKARYRRDARARTEKSTALYCAEIDQNMRLYGVAYAVHHFPEVRPNVFFCVASLQHYLLILLYKRSLTLCTRFLGFLHCISSTSREKHKNYFL